MIQIYLSLAVAIVGFCLYVGTARPPIQRVGEIMLFCGLLAFLLTFAGHAVRS